MNSLVLYRKVLRVAAKWPVREEAVYIRQEARSLFEANRTLQGEELRAAISDGEQRLELGVHYENPYPRLIHQGGQSIIQSSAL